MAALERSRARLRPGGILSVCDGRPFPGRLRVPNPLLRRAYGWATGWHPERDLPADIRAVFGHVAVRSFNFGSIFVATARR